MPARPGTSGSFASPLVTFYLWVYQTHVIRRVCALLLALLVLVEGAGVARALSSVEAIECCCGKHDAHRACKCKACPILKKRAHAATTRLEVGRDCHGQEDPGVLS